MHISRRKNIVCFPLFETKLLTFTETCSSKQMIWSVCECLTGFFNHVNQTFNPIFGITSLSLLSPVFSIRLYDHCWFSIVSRFIWVFHCMCRKLQIYFGASAMFVSGEYVTLVQLFSSILAAAPFILSLVVREIVEKPCSSKDANSGLLLGLNHLLQTVPVVKWIKVIVVAILKTVAN